MPAVGEIVLHRGRGEQRGRAEHVVAAAVPVAAALDLLRLRDAGDLRQAGQGVVLAEDRDHRAAVAGLAHHGGRDAGDVLGDAEAFLLQHGAMLGDRAVFRIGDLRHAPDAVGQRLVVRPCGRRRAARFSPSSAWASSLRMVRVAARLSRFRAGQNPQFAQCRAVLDPRRAAFQTGAKRAPGEESDVREQDETEAAEQRARARLRRASPAHQRDRHDRGGDRPRLAVHRHGAWRDLGARGDADLHRRAADRRDADRAHLRRRARRGHARARQRRARRDRAACRYGGAGQAIAQAFRYPPIGHRSWGGPPAVFGFSRPAMRRRRPR